MTARRKTGPARPMVTITVDGAPLQVPSGEPLATALLCAGHLRLRHSPNGGGARGAFCFMGVCQECAVHVDGRLTQSCQTAARAGMIVRLGGAP